MSVFGMNVFDKEFSKDIKMDYFCCLQMQNLKLCNFSQIHKNIKLKVFYKHLDINFVNILLQFFHSFIHTLGT